MFKLDLENAEEPEIKLPKSARSSKKQGSFRKPLTVENSEREGNTRPPELPLEKFICRSGSNS